MTTESTFSERLTQLNQRIHDAAIKAGRDPAEITLLPVSKTFGDEAIREAVAAGCRRLGENKVQEIVAKQETLADCHIDWVMIGHLQSNKARDVARYATEIQSLDRISLAKALERRLQHEGRQIDALVQVKTSTEPSKYGANPDELLTLIKHFTQHMPSIHIKGLMTMAIHSRDEAAVRQCFRTLRELRDEVRAAGIEGVTMDKLSMGMSGDMELAIAEGATEVRIGTALFGARPYGDDYYWPE